MMNNVLPFHRAPSLRSLDPPYPISCARTIAFGWIVIGVLFGGFGSWASLAPLSSAAIAPGTVVVDSNRKSVQHLEGGVIREIFVRDGDMVEPNQILLQLDGAAVRAALASLQPMLTTNEARKARLRAEREGLDKIAFPGGIVAEAKIKEATAQIIAGQERIFETRRHALHGEKALNSNRLAQSRQRLEGLEKQLRVKEGEMALMGSQLAAQKTLLAKGYATQQQVAAAQRMVQQLDSEYTDLQSKTEETKILAERYELEDSQIGKNFMEQVENELYETEHETYQLLERMRAIEDQYQRLEVRAPVSGVVVNMVAHTVGGVIGPGSLIMDIVPKNDRLIIEAQVRPSDVEGVKEGTLADVRFPGLDGTEIPRLNGKVVLVSADRLIGAAGSAYFVVRVQVDDAELARLAGWTLIPGMPAEVLIRKRERTLLSYLLAPLFRGVWTAMRE